MILPRDLHQLVRRYCTDSDYMNNYCSSPWDSWVRWLVLGLLVLGFFFIFVVCSCITARRRRRQGLRPYYGTGWAGGHGQVNYYPNQGPPPHHNSANNAQPYYGQPAPPYSPPNQGYYSAGNNYFTPQHTGIELQNQGQPQPPQQSYHQPQRSGDAYEPVYAAPSGPPPGKGGVAK